MVGAVGATILLPGCDGRDDVEQVVVNDGDQPGAETNATPSRTTEYDEVAKGWQSARVGFTDRSDVFPQRDAEEKGTFTAAGLKDMFEEIAGIDLPTWVVPAIGRYRVRKYHSWSEKDFNAAVSGYFRIPPERSEELRKIVVGAWKEQLGDQGAAVGENIMNGESSFGETLVFSPGSLNAFVGSNEAAGDHGFAYRLLIDPASGLVHLSSFQGYSE